MTKQPIQVRYWLIGLGVFAVVFVLAVLLSQQSAFGIPDHQLAANGGRVDEIQAAWRADGVRILVILSMIADLVFIGVYGWGSVLVGKSCIRLTGKILPLLGRAIVLGAIVFMAADYCETLLQIFQVITERGVDWMAAVAAAMQSPKNLAFAVTFFGVLLGLLLHRFSKPAV